MERGVQRKLHAPCEWGEKPEAKSQGLTYPYPMSVDISTLASFPNSPPAETVCFGSSPEANGSPEPQKQRRE